MTEPLIAVVGPTAVGKSAFALHLALHLGGEIINSDALQVYRGLDIGTAKPPRAVRLLVPHHLVDIIDPDQPYSAGEFSRRARALVSEIQSRGRIPILVGGSGLYSRAFFEGLSPIPAVDEALRSWLRTRIVREGLPRLRRDLEVLDPVTATRLTAGDTQRVARALEVALGTGYPLSYWTSTPASRLGVAALRIGLTLPRTVLYDRIEDRVRDMIDQGWVDEVAGLLDSGLSPELPAFQAIGYRQLAAHVRGSLSLDQALEETIRATRRYAKRQETWFRGEPNVRWLEAIELEHRIPEIVRWMRQCGLGRVHDET